MWMQTGRAQPEVNILSADKWMRIKHELNRSKVDEEQQNRTRASKALLHEKSKEMVKAWPISLANIRAKKLKAHKERAEKEEEEKKKVDAEYAQLKAKERREAIEKAELALYEQTDKVKTLHSGFKLSEVIKERDNQVKLRNEIEKKRKEREYQYAKHMWDDVEQHTNKQKMLLEKRRAKNIEHSKELNEQLEMMKTMKRKQRQEDMEEAEQLKEDFIAYQERENLKKQENRRQAELWVEDYRKDLVNRQKQRIEENTKMEIENEKIKKYSEGKQEIERQIQLRQKELELQRTVEKERIMHIVQDKLKKKEENEELRLKKAQEENAVKQAALEREQQLKRQAMLQDMDRWKEIQAEERRKMREKELAAQKIEKEQIDTEANAFKEKEEEKKKHHRQRSIEVQNFLKQQKEVAAKRKEHEKNELKNDAEKMYKDLVKEEDRFQEYANNLIKKSESKSRNTFPMKKLVGESHRKREDAFEYTVPAGKKVVNTWKRLGFQPELPKTDAADGADDKTCVNILHHHDRCSMP